MIILYLKWDNPEFFIHSPLNLSLYPLCIHKYTIVGVYRPIIFKGYMFLTFIEWVIDKNSEACDFTYYDR